jgi:hypothetical protein
MQVIHGLHVSRNGDNEYQVSTPTVELVKESSSGTDRMP